MVIAAVAILALAVMAVFVLHEKQVPIDELLPKLRDHFQVVRDLFGPRIRQSKWLKAKS